ncbi:MAG: NifU family protein [Chitinophagaceae bacterium]
MIKTGNPLISIYTEATPNPEMIKFVANKLLYPNKSIEILPHEIHLSPLAQELYTFPFIKSVFIASNFITIGKTLNTQWEDIVPHITQFLKEYLNENKAIVNEQAITEKNLSTASEEDESSVTLKIKEILDNYVRPAVEMDGGAIQFKSYHKGVVVLVLQGACSGCPSSSITLKAGIEGMMKRMIPEVKEVVAENE